jgi:hypothetical protein
MQIRHTLVALALVAGATKTGMNPSSPAGEGRTIQMPDTLGANFAIGDSANKSGTPADYDALVGTWEFRFQSRDGQGRFQPAFTGHWTFEKKPGGGLIEDRWRPDNPSVPMAVTLYTYRIFDAERKVWQMYGTWPGSGEIEPGLTWSDGVSRFAIQRSKSGISRIRYLQIDKNKFLWRSDHSVDGGKTWMLDAGTMEARRISQ